MSRFVKLNDQLKSAAAQGRLTPSQAACQRFVQERLRDPGLVGIYGVSGSGKTFLAWALATTNGAYIPLPELLPERGARERLHIVDNCFGSREAIRDLIRRLSLADITRAVLLLR